MPSRVKNRSRHQKYQAEAHTRATLPHSHGHLDGLVTVQKHLPLLAATLANQLEPEVDVNVGANIVIAADKHLWKQHEPHNKDIDHMSKRNMPLSVSTTSAARKRGGTRRPPLPPLLPLPLGRRRGVAGVDGRRQLRDPPFDGGCAASSREVAEREELLNHLPPHVPPPPLLRLPLHFLLFLLRERNREEAGDGGGVHVVAASQRHHHQERSPGSHVTGRGCRTLRTGHLKRRRRPRPRRQGLRSPWGVVRLAPCLLPGSCPRLAP